MFVRREVIVYEEADMRRAFEAGFLTCAERYAERYETSQPERATATLGFQEWMLSVLKEENLI